MHNPATHAFCDYLTLSVPYDHSGGVVDGLLDVMSPATPKPQVGKVGVYDVGFGTFFTTRRGQVVIVSWSGAALDRLRSLGLLEPVIWFFVDAGYPHRVTRLDAAHDVRGRPAGPVVRSIYRRYRASGVRLSSRPVPVTARFAVGPDGDDTGTVYAGHNTSARVQAAIYDKRKEQLDRFGLEVADWLRFELRCFGGSSGPPVTLRDVLDPVPLFWAFMSPTFLELPPGAAVTPWTPGDLGGFKIPKREPVEPADRLKRYVEHGGADELVRLASQCGPHWSTMLNSLLTGRLPAVGASRRPEPAAGVEAP